MLEILHGFILLDCKGKCSSWLLNLLKRLFKCVISFLKCSLQMKLDTLYNIKATLELLYVDVIKAYSTIRTSKLC